jgi:hypothetical protein
MAIGDPGGVRYVNGSYPGEVCLLSRVCRLPLMKLNSGCLGKQQRNIPGSEEHVKLGLGAYVIVREATRATLRGGSRGEGWTWCSRVATTGGAIRAWRAIFMFPQVTLFIKASTLESQEQS